MKAIRMIPLTLTLAWVLGAEPTSLLEQSSESERTLRVPTASSISLNEYPGKEAEVVGTFDLQGERSVIVVRKPSSIHFGLEREGGDRVLLAEVAQAAFTILNRFVMGWIEVHPEKDLGAAWFLYLENQGGRRFNYTWTHLVVCSLEGHRATSPCKVLEVASTDWAHHLYLDEDSKWVYFRLDSDPGEPATISDVRILTGDFNDDGYGDLMVWRRSCRPMTPAELRRDSGNPECEIHFLPSEEEFLVSLYEPATKEFLELESRPDLPEPDKSLWNALPCLGWVYIPRGSDGDGER